MSERRGGWPGEAEDPDDGDAETTPSGEEVERGVAPPAPRARRPPRGLESRDRPRVASRYSLFVGLAFAVLAVVAVYNAVQTDEGGVAGADPDARRGAPVSEFAVPDVRSDLVGDANLDQDNCASSRNPCPPGDVRLPACELDEPGAIRICDLFDKPLAISFWFTRGGDCLDTQDNFDAVAARRSGEINFLSLNELDDRAEVESIVSGRRWTVPVGHDADGAVSNLFQVGGCPTIMLAYPGGIIHAFEIGNQTEEQIDAILDDLLAASAEREPQRAGTE